MKNITLVLLFLFMAIPAHAADMVKKGGTIPTVAALENQDGDQLKLYDLYGSKGMTLVFYRSAGWCPYCQKQLIDLNKKADEFKKAGYPLVAISYDRAAILQKFDAKHKISFPLLSDPASEVIRAFGIMDESYAKGTFAYGVPKPAIYVVNTKGKVERLYSKANYKDRPDISVILKEIKPAASVYKGEEFPADPDVIEGEIEMMEPTAEAIDAPAIAVPAVDDAIEKATEAATEVSDKVMEQAPSGLAMPALPEATMEQPSLAPAIEQKVEELMEPATETITEPTVDSVMDEAKKMMEKKADSVAEPVSDAVMDQVKPMVEPVVEDMALPEMEMPDMKSPLE